jgi:signal transduction histidine kinase
LFLPRQTTRFEERKVGVKKFVREFDDVWRTDGRAADECATASSAPRAFRLKMVGAVGCSYAVDSLMLTLFAIAGTVSPTVPMAYAAAGLGHVLIFGLLHWTGLSQKSANPHLVVWQVAYGVAAQLMGLTLAPTITSYFLSIIFIAFGFGMLRMSFKHALWMWVLACLATGAVLIAFRGEKLAVIHPSVFEASVILLSFSLVLLRCLLLGYYSTMLRVRLFRDNIELTDHIAERQRMEAELQLHRQHLEELVKERTMALSIAKEAAESASRAKSAFLATMSHELRTPLNGIMGFAALAQWRATDAEQKAQLEKVAHAGNDLLAKIESILDFTLAESNRLTLERRAFRLGAVLENVASLQSSRAAEKGLQFALKADPALAACEVTGDPGRLRQVILELTGNAIKFTDQGSIGVDAELEEATAAEIVVRFAIRDSGIGLSAEERARLFRPFEQADSSSTRRFGGTGVGLAISRQLVQLMGGDIGVESEPGQGSTFRFTVRLGKANEAATASPLA